MSILFINARYNFIMIPFYVWIKSEGSTEADGIDEGIKTFLNLNTDDKLVRLFESIIEILIKLIKLKVSSQFIRIILIT